MQMDLAIPMGACILGIIKVHETTLTITNGLQGLPNPNNSVIQMAIFLKIHHKTTA